MNYTSHLFICFLREIQVKVEIFWYIPRKYETPWWGCGDDAPEIFDICCLVYLFRWISIMLYKYRSPQHRRDPITSKALYIPPPLCRIFKVIKKSWEKDKTKKEKMKKRKRLIWSDEYEEAPTRHILVFFRLYLVLTLSLFNLIPFCNSKENSR